MDSPFLDYPFFWIRKLQYFKLFLINLRYHLTATFPVPLCSAIQNGWLPCGIAQPKEPGNKITHFSLIHHSRQINLKN